jgi:hypothetical protein
MASIPTCGVCRSGIGRLMESGEPRSKSLREGTIKRMCMRSANFEYVPVWRFGNSRATPLAEQTD